ncbi:MAG: helix-turn-helix domain-containing protein [Lachnospiraceae bacterium]|nr:helix-turn-helix domain-containing protein [Lachnospiraceae bacterium]
MSKIGDKKEAAEKTCISNLTIDDCQGPNMWYKVGNRIYECRSEIIIDGKKMTQEDLAEKIGKITGKGITRSTVIGWEKGKPVAKLEQLVALCEIFNCEMGYLLCEEGFETKTRATADIQAQSGLSLKAVKTLTSLSKNSVSIMLIEDLLSESSELDHIATLYKEFKDTLTFGQAEEQGILPFSDPPGDHCEGLFMYEAKDLALFRFNNAIVSFARKHDK